ncbi:MAG: hypothetical protein HYV65_00730 [Candidatus Spechtbacteria bacterium]|nr:hypothetical protein [Candidatus Spechtbacteria bacterium]
MFINASQKHHKNFVIFSAIAGFALFAPSSRAATASLINDGDTIRVVGAADVYIVKILGTAPN